MYCLKMISTTTFPRVDKHHETMDTATWRISFTNIFNKFFIVPAAGDGSCFFRAFYKGTNYNGNLQEENEFVKLYRLQSAVYSFLKSSVETPDQELINDINTLSKNDTIEDKKQVLTDIIKRKLKNESKDILHNFSLINDLNTIHNELIQKLNSIHELQQKLKQQLEQENETLEEEISQGYDRLDKLKEDITPKILNVLLLYENLHCWAEMHDIVNMYLIHDTLCITYDPSKDEIFYIDISMKPVTGKTKIILLKNIAHTHFDLYAMNSTVYHGTIITNLSIEDIKTYKAAEYRYFNYIYTRFCNQQKKCFTGGASKQSLLRWKKQKKNTTSTVQLRDIRRVVEIIKRGHAMYP